MARPREFDTDTAIERICDQFWSRGFEATSVADLEEVTGLARARLYGAFGSKRKMLHRSIDFYLERWVERLFAGVGEKGMAGAVGVFEAIARICAQRPERAAMGCLLVNSAIELGNADPEMTSRAERYRSLVRAAFRSALQSAADDGQEIGDVEVRTDQAFLLLMGLYVSIKGGASLPEINRLADAAIETVRGWPGPLKHPRPDG